VRGTRPEESLELILFLRYDRIIPEGPTFEIWYVTGLSVVNGSFVRSSRQIVLAQGFHGTKAT